jgi:outer membrane protein
MSTHSVFFLALFSLSALCSAQQTPVTPAQPERLTLAEAERIAIAHNPRVSIAHLLALAQAQQTRVVRSGELPYAEAGLTAVDAHDNSRLTAGALNNPIVYNRAAGGLTLRQLLTDFGRTHNLVRSEQEKTKAQLEMEQATEQDIRLAVAQVFYQTLSAQAVLHVARQTEATRRTTAEQIAALAQNKLRSTLDLSLAQVQVSEAQLLVLDAEDAKHTAMANLDALLGSEENKNYDLADETTADPQPAPDDVEALVKQAFTSRPDLAALGDRELAAKRFAAAERDLSRPTLSALAAGGGTPVRANQIASAWYGAAGVNLSIPVFNGFAFASRAKAADLQARAASEQVRDLRDSVARDVRTAALDAQRAYQRIGVTKELLDQANLAMDLAQARYQVGLSGIVDLTQSQLAQTEAQIGYTNARYDYQTAWAEVRYQTGQE